LPAFSTLDPLAEVLAGEKLEERLGKGCKTGDDILARLSACRLQDLDQKLSIAWLMNWLVSVSRRAWAGRPAWQQAETGD